MQLVSSGGNLMRAPAFWWREPGHRSALLAPFAAIYGAIAARRLAQPGARVGIPVICVGNPTVGGAGKTPTAHRDRQTADRGRRAAGVPDARLWRRARRARCRSIPAPRAGTSATSRCCSRASRRPSSRATAWPARGSRAERGASVIVMDDGFQNPSLAKDLSDPGRRRGAASAMAACFRPGRCARRSRRSSRAPTRCWSIGRGGAPAIDAAARARGLPIFHARLEPDRRRGRAAARHGRCSPSPASAIRRNSSPRLSAAGIDAAGRGAAFPITTATAPPRRARSMREADRDGPRAADDRKGSRPAEGRRAAAQLAGRARALPVTLVLDGSGAFRRLVLARIKRDLIPPRGMALQHGLGARVGLLQVDAPVFQFLQRDRHAGHGAAHERARPHDAEIAVEELDLRFPRHGRGPMKRLSTFSLLQGRGGPSADPPRHNIMARSAA